MNNEQMNERIMSMAVQQAARWVSVNSDMSKLANAAELVAEEVFGRVIRCTIDSADQNLTESEAEDLKAWALEEDRKLWKRIKSRKS